MPQTNPILLKHNLGVGIDQRHIQIKRCFSSSIKSDLSKQVLKGSIPISAKEGIGIDVLNTEMVSAVVGTLDLENDTIIANARHHEALLENFGGTRKSGQRFRRWNYW